ncbi:cell division protein FtsW [Fulvitalea axinellae]|uniref:Probable peptidoglycan glycosyltransferase FtsW n=1 Tax=Fulvitalea axinellae TaxID=1182444 RepID=A0AAU9CWK8_9BACT|nr:cell division protein FtsW [Fulvitalea axinellae]
MDIVKKIANKHLKGDPIVWAIVFCLMAFSVLVVYSASGNLAYRNAGGNTEYYLIKHSILLALSFCVMWIAHKIDFRYYPIIAKVGLLLSVPLLLFTWFYGPEINEASRWMIIPIVEQRFQPSDLAKLALISSLAGMLSKRQHEIENCTIKDLLPMLAWMVVICGLIGLSDLSTSGLLFTTGLLIMFIGRVPLKRLGVIIVAGLMVGALAIVIGQRGPTFVSRIKTHLDPTALSFQSEQSYIAVAKGGLLGEGPGNSKQKNFLPHPYSDFVYAIIIEEYGIGGGLFMLILYLGLLYRGMLVASKSDRPLGGLLSAGLSFSLVLQALINMGVVVGLMPVTGLTLPFVSMGGTSLLFTGVALGIILSVSRGESSAKVQEPVIRPKGNVRRKMTVEA